MITFAAIAISSMGLFRVLTKGHEEHPEPPAYPYLKIRNKPYPWGEPLLSSLATFLLAFHVGSVLAPPRELRPVRRALQGGGPGVSHLPSSFPSLTSPFP